MEINSRLLPSIFFQEGGILLEAKRVPKGLPCLNQQANAKRRGLDGTAHERFEDLPVAAEPPRRVGRPTGAISQPASSQIART